MEQVDLGVPYGAVVGSTRWVVQDLHLHRGLIANAGVITPVPAQSSIKVIFLGSHGHTLSHAWVGAAADADLTAFNKLNLTTNTLHKRIMNKAIGDGVFTGAVSGAPD